MKHDLKFLCRFLLLSNRNVKMLDDEKIQKFISPEKPISEKEFHEQIIINVLFKQENTINYSFFSREIGNKALIVFFIPRPVAHEPKH